MREMVEAGGRCEGRCSCNFACLRRTATSLLELELRDCRYHCETKIKLPAAAVAAAALLQLCPTLCDPIDGSPPGSPVPGILQARTLEWVAISFSNA